MKEWCVANMNKASEKGYEVEKWRKRGRFKQKTHVRKVYYKLRQEY